MQQRLVAVAASSGTRQPQPARRSAPHPTMHGSVRPAGPSDAIRGGWILHRGPFPVAAVEYGRHCMTRSAKGDSLDVRHYVPGMRLREPCGWERCQGDPSASAVGRKSSCFRARSGHVMPRRPSASHQRAVRGRDMRTAQRSPCMAERKRCRRGWARARSQKPVIGTRITSCVSTSTRRNA